uniref:Metaxin 2 n=1 Tax=Canis lupus familiaris TaxID=9615 RepID=A0A8P0TDN9_CANLF
MSLVAEAFVSQIAAAEPWPENATLYQQLKGEQILLSDNAASLAVQAFLQMCNLPIKVVCRANAEYMSPSGKVPFIHVGNQVVSELGPIVQFVKAKGHSLSDGLDEVQKAEMKAYMELVNNMLLTAELYLQWCDEATVGEITHARYGSPYPWPLNHILAYQKQWEVKRKMKAIGWGNKTLDQVLEDVDQCCQALSQRLGTQPYFFNKQSDGDPDRNKTGRQILTPERPAPPRVSQAISLQMPHTPWSAACGTDEVLAIRK